MDDNWPALEILSFRRQPATDHWPGVILGGHLQPPLLLYRTDIRSLVAFCPYRTLFPAHPFAVPASDTRTNPPGRLFESQTLVACTLQANRLLREETTGLLASGGSCSSSATQKLLTLVLVDCLGHAPDNTQPKKPQEARGQSTRQGCGVQVDPLSALVCHMCLPGSLPG